MEKYVQLAKQLNMVNAMIISPQQIFFDIRTILKCRWGCGDFFRPDVRCGDRGITYQQRIEMIKRCHRILLVHSHDARELSASLLEIERAAFLDGSYLAFAIRFCSLCKTCAVEQGSQCPTPDKVRPCESSFCIDVFKTVRNLGLPCEPLKDKNHPQDRYGFVLLD